MEGTYPHCLCVRSVLAWIRPLYTGILHAHTHAFSSFTRVYLSCAGWRRLSSSLFRATVDYLTQLSVVPSWANPSSTSSSSSSCSTRSIFSPPLVSFAIVSSRPYRFVVYTPRFRPIVTGMKSGRRWEEGWRGGERKRVRLTILSLERGDSFPLAEFTRPGHRLTVKGITEIVFEISSSSSFSPFSLSRVSKAFRCSSPWDFPRSCWSLCCRALITSLRFERYRGEIGEDPRESLPRKIDIRDLNTPSDVPCPKITLTWGDKQREKWNSFGWLLFT